MKAIALWLVAGLVWMTGCLAVPDFEPGTEVAAWEDPAPAPQASAGRTLTACEAWSLCPLNIDAPFACESSSTCEVGCCFGHRWPAGTIYLGGDVWSRCRLPPGGAFDACDGCSDGACSMCAPPGC